MKTYLFFIYLMIFFSSFGFSLSQENNSQQVIKARELKKEKIGIIIYSNEPETVWNAFRLANFSQEEGDTVSVFLLGKGVEAPEINNPDFNIKEKINSFIEKGGKILACGSCLNMRKTKGKGNLCTVSSLSDLYDIIKKSDKLLTF
jgi:uncharacterized protein involved in oxidation of intracellular sulfur